MADLCIEFLQIWIRWRIGAESVSFDNESFGDFSEVRYHVRVMTLGYVVFCGTWAHPCCSRKVILIKEKIPPLHECTSPSPLFKVIENAMGRFWKVYLEKNFQVEQ